MNCVKKSPYDFALLICIDVALCRSSTVCANQLNLEMFLLFHSNKMNLFQSVHSIIAVGTAFLQRERCCRQRNIRHFPRNFFSNDLIKFVAKTRAGSNNVVLAADINEHVVEGKFLRALKQITLMEVFYRRFKPSGTASCCRGRMQIDGV